LVPETDEAKLRQFLTMPNAQFAELSLERDIRPYLNSTDFETISASWRKAVQGDFSGQKAQAAEYQAVQSVMIQAGIIAGESKEAQSEQNQRNKAQFKNSYDRLRAAFVQKHQVEPTPQEAQKIAEQLLVEVRMSGTGLFSDNLIPAWQVRAGQERDAYIAPGDIDVDELTPNERQRAVERLGAMGVQQVNDETIAEAYLQILEARGLKVKR
jgi:hypothetical protein